MAKGQEDSVSVSQFLIHRNQVWALYGYVERARSDQGRELPVLRPRGLQAGFRLHACVAAGGENPGLTS